MFRIKQPTNKDINFYQSGNSLGGLERLKRFVRTPKFFKITGIILVLFAAYLIWNHGQLLPKKNYSAEELAQARLETPMTLEWVELYFGTKICTRANWCGPEADPDKDGISNYQEYLFFTNPTDPDSDGDGTEDGEELRNYKNPLGAGNVQTARDITDPYDVNPATDEFTKQLAQDIKEGDAMSIEQIQLAAVNLTEFPQFNEVAFAFSYDNNQETVSRYAAAYGQLAQNYLQDSSVIDIATIADSNDLERLDKFINAVSLFAASLTFIPAPTDVTAFHKAAFGSLAYQGLIADTQKDFVEGKVSQTASRDKIRAYTVYYTRFVMDQAKAAKDLNTKYDFPFTFED